MHNLLIGVLAALPNILVAVFSKILTSAIMQDVIERVIIYSLKKAAPLTTNTLDDELVALITERLQELPPK